MEDSFNFMLLRISIAQILKASGFDKCKPSTLNIITDLYIQYFTKLIKTCLKCSQLRTRSNNVELQDITQALILIGSIKPNNILQLFDDTFEESKYNTKSMDSFVNWPLYNENFQTAKRLNELLDAYIKNLIEKRKLDLNDGETDQQRRKRKYKERQDYYNQLKLNDPDHHGHEDAEEEDDITSKDRLKWLNYLIEKDLKLGHDLKFLNTSDPIIDEFLKYQNNNKFHPVEIKNKDKRTSNLDRINQHLYNLHKNDYIVEEIEALEQPEEEATGNGQTQEEEQPVIKPSEELTSILPYNLQYNQHLLEDDLSKFLQDNDGSDEMDMDNGSHDHEHDDHVETNELVQDDNLLFDHGHDETHDGMIISDEGIGGDNNLMFM